MKYMKSTSSKSYSVNGVVIPANTSSEWLVLTNEKALDIQGVAVIKGLIKAGSILVTEKEPAEMTRTPGALLNANGKLKQELAEAKAELEKLKAEKDAVLQGNEAAQALEASQKELAEAKAELETVRKELEAQKAAYEALDKEAKEIIADLNVKLTNAKKAKKGQDE